MPSPSISTPNQKPGSPLLHFVGSLILALITLLTYPMYYFAINAGPNSTLGYRTARSRSSEYAWELANQLAANYSVIISIILTILVLIVSALLYFRGVRNEKAWQALTYGTLGALIIGTIIMFILVESQLGLLAG